MLGAIRVVSVVNETKKDQNLRQRSASVWRCGGVASRVIVHHLVKYRTFFASLSVTCRLRSVSSRLVVARDVLSSPLPLEGSCMGRICEASDPTKSCTTRCCPPARSGSSSAEYCAAGSSAVGRAERWGAPLSGRVGRPCLLTRDAGNAMPECTASG